MALTNYILRLCVQKNSDVEVLQVAAEVAKESNEWVEVDFRDGRRVASVGPEGQILLPKNPKDK